MWEQSLPNRLPDFYKGESELSEYLEVCGSVLDDLVDTIKEHDYYKDYKKVPEKRLLLLANRFNFNPPADMTESVLRGIVRDIAIIHKTRGVEAALYWVFKILSWDVEIRQAWLPEPERYDPRIRQLFPSLYLRELSDQIFTEVRSYTVRVDDPYQIDGDLYRFHINDIFIFNDFLKIGKNGLQWIGDLNDTLNVDPNKPTTDVKKIGYRNFLYGTAKTTDVGTYFDGGDYFDETPTYTDLRIVGECYNEENVIRKDPKVLATPYLVVKVSGSDFDKFTQPYIGADGEVYTYTSKESFKVVDALLGYLLNDYTRPANVSIMLITAEASEKEIDELSLNEEVTEEITFDYVSAGDIKIGGGFVIGAPTAATTNSISNLRTLSIGESFIETDGHIFSEELFEYSITNIEWEEDVDEGVWYSKHFYQLRTPTRVRFNLTNDGDVINIETKRTVGSPDWIPQIEDVADTDVYEFYDILFFRLMSEEEPTGDITFDSKWLPQSTLTDPATFSNVVKVTDF